MERYPALSKPSPANRPPVAIKGRDLAESQIGVGQPIASGALVSGVYKTMLTLTAPGVIKYCGAASVGPGTRDVGLRVVIDGVVVYDWSGTSGAQFSGPLAIGAGGGAGKMLDRVPFNTLQVQVKSSLSETDAVNLYCLYDLVAP